MLNYSKGFIIELVFKVAVCVAEKSVEFRGYRMKCCQILQIRSLRIVAGPKIIYIARLKIGV